MEHSPEVLTERFQIAKQQGRVRRFSETNLPGPSESVILHIPKIELKRARQLAAVRGLPYEIYLETLIQEALANEERKLAG